MSGVKGRSGRRPLTDEKRRHLIIDKAWEVAYEILCNPKVSLSSKVEIARSIVTKSIPAHIDFRGEMTYLIEKYKDMSTEELISRIGEYTDNQN